MEKLKAKDIIAYRKLSPQRKQTFLKNLKSPPEKTDGGGDYWVSCITAIYNSFIANEPRIIKEKIEYLLDVKDRSALSITKNRHQRNIDILKNYKSDDFSRLKPNRKLVFLPRTNAQSIITLKDISVQIKPTHVFSFKNNGSEEIGGTWFIAQKDGFKKPELGIFADLLYRYLSTHYSNKYTINTNYCTAIDVINCTEVKYSWLANNEANKLLDDTLEDIKIALRK